MFWRARNQFARAKRKLQRPTITDDHGTLAPGTRDRTFVVAVGPLFDQTVPNAITTCRLGWCRAMEQLGIPYVIVGTTELARRLPTLPDPIVLISGSDYDYLSSRSLATLKQCDHAVWVGNWFDGDTEFYSEHGLPYDRWTDSLKNKILSSDPRLLFTISPESRFEYYAGWLSSGIRLASLPMACDTSLYDLDVPAVAEFEDVEMAFVGGYWDYKARSFDLYLRPYADRLRVYGYSAWPYAGYGGQLAVDKEPALYRQARLSPTVNEPHVSIMGIDQNERIFKVLGSGGMTVTDAVPEFREWFTADELLVPSDLEEYHDLVHLALTDDATNERFRAAGRHAVLDRHTYVHRAKQLLRLLGRDPSVTAS